VGLRHKLPGKKRNKAVGEERRGEERRGEERRGEGRRWSG